MLAIVVLAGRFGIVWQPFTPAFIGEVIEGSAADAAGFQPGDEVIAVDGRAVARFEELQRIVVLRPEETINFTVLRDGAALRLQATLAREIGMASCRERVCQYV